MFNDKKNIEEIEESVLGNAFKKIKVIRLNKLGLIIIALIVSLVIFFLIYSFDYRKNKRQELTKTTLPFYQVKEIYPQYSISKEKSQEIDNETEQDYSNLYPGVNDDLENSHQLSEMNSSLLPVELSLEEQARYSPLSKPFLPESQLEKKDHLEKFWGQLGSKVGEENNSKSNTHSPLMNFEKINAGTLIPSILMTGINSDLPGSALAQVRSNVYDFETGQKIIIPRGSKILLTYDHEIAYGQERVLLQATHLIFPEGQTQELDHSAVMDNHGMSGFHDQKNSHYFRIYGSALALGALNTKLQRPSYASSPILESPSAGQEMMDNMAQHIGEMASQTISQNLVISPTLSIRPGYLFNILVLKDVILHNA